jgi:hypothetical protein
MGAMPQPHFMPSAVGVPLAGLSYGWILIPCISSFGSFGSFGAAFGRPSPGRKDLMLNYDCR